MRVLLLTLVVCFIGCGGGGEKLEAPPPAAPRQLTVTSPDFPAGGAWELTMLIGSRPVHWHGEYVEVDEPERLVFTVSDQPGDDRYELVTVVLTDLGDGRTEMLFEQRGQMGPEQYEAAKTGWGGFFDRVDERLA